MTGDSMDGDRSGSISRGSVVLERLVPVDDLRVGDVVTYQPPPSADVEGMVTHRIVAIGPDGITTQGDGNAAPDPWRLRPDTNIVPRVVFSLPWIGYAYLVLADPILWLLLVGSLGVLAVLLATSIRRSRVATPALVDVHAGAER
jgi:signal peptidase